MLISTRHSLFVILGCLALLTGCGSDDGDKAGSGGAPGVIDHRTEDCSESAFQQPAEGSAVIGEDEHLLRATLTRATPTSIAIEADCSNDDGDQVTFLYLWLDTAEPIGEGVYDADSADIVSSFGRLAFTREGLEWAGKFEAASGEGSVHTEEFSFRIDESIDVAPTGSGDREISREYHGEAEMNLFSVDAGAQAQPDEPRALLKFSF